MTDEDRTNEQTSTIFTAPLSTTVTVVNLTKSSAPTFDTAYLKELKPDSKLNYSTGISAWCLNTMVSEVDCNSARKRNHKKYNEGKLLDSKIAEWKAQSGGKVFSADEVRLGLGVLNKIKRNKYANKKKEREAKKKASVEHVNLVREVELIKEEMR